MASWTSLHGPVLGVKKNKEEGNEFRKWMQENYSDFKDGKEPLSPEGDYNNKTIQQAYKEYGEEYKKSQEKK